MKLFAKLFLSLLIFNSFVFSQNKTEKIINKVFSLTDSQLKPFLNNNIKDFNIKEPTFKIEDNNKDSSQTIDPYIYMPIFTKAIYEYEYISSEFENSKKIIVEYKGYSEKEFMTQVSVTYIDKNTNKILEYNIKITDKGIFVSDSILSGSRTEIPMPLFKGKKWTENSDENKISTFSAKTSVPFGNFENCLKITTKIGGGDAGIAERYYAPQIGLVLETINAEDKQETLKLTSFKKI